MNYRNQSFLFWAKTLGYLQDFKIGEWDESDLLDEFFLKDLKICQEHLWHIRFLYIEQCLLQWLLSENRLNKQQYQEYLNRKILESKQGLENLLWTCLEYNFIPIYILKKQAEILAEQKIFSQEDCAFIQKTLFHFQQKATIEEIHAPIRNTTVLDMECSQQNSSVEEIKKNQPDSTIMEDIHVSNILNSIGGYQILEEIGRGGMGRVYKAYHPKLKKTIAIKVMLKSQNEKYRKRFLSEAQMMAKLNHPNIITIHDIGTYDGQDYIVMDFIEGEPLSDILKNTKFSTRKSLEIMKEVADGMAYAHNSGIIHRDLKPSNIMIGKKSSRPIIMDFGLAKNLKENEDLTKSGEIIGTPKYMSPEQVEGKSARITYASDVYALGAILYEMLTRQEVVSGSETHQIIFKIIYHEIVPPCVYNPLLSKEVEAICLKALEKNQASRYQNAQELFDDIDRFLNGEAVLARPARWNRKLWKKMLKHKVAMLLSAFILFSMTMIGIFLTQTKVSWEKDLAVNISLWWTKFEGEIKEDMPFLKVHREGMEKGKELVNNTIVAYGKWKKLYQEQIREKQLLMKNRPSLIEDWEKKKNHRTGKEKEYFLSWIQARKSLFEYWKKLQRKKDLVGKYNYLQEQYKNLVKDSLEKKAIYEKIQLEKIEKITYISEIKNFFGENILQKPQPAEAFSLALQNYVQKIMEESLKEFSPKEEEQILQSWIASCILILHKKAEYAEKIQNAVDNSTGTEYQSILEKIINQRNLSQSELLELQDKLEIICLKNFSFGPAYYQIARIYHQNDKKEMAQIYYEMALECSESIQGTQDFFTRYYLSKIYYDLWHVYLRKKSILEDSDSKKIEINEREAELLLGFQKNQALLKKIPVSKEQKSYLKMNEFYTLLMEEERQILEKYKKLTIMGYLHFYIYPSDFYTFDQKKRLKISQEEYQNDCNRAIFLYEKLLKILEEIQGEMFSSEVACLKAQIYKDMILLQKRSPDFFSDVLKNLKKALSDQKWNYSIWKDLADVYLILGDYTNLEDFYRHGISIHPDASWYYILYLLNQKDRSWEAMKELEYHLQFYLNDIEPEEDKDSNVNFNMKRNLLGFLYLKENQTEKLIKIFPYLEPVVLQIEKNVSMKEMEKICLGNFTYILVCAKLNKDEEAKKCIETLWKISLKNTPEWGRFKDTMLIKTFINSLKKYHDPFLCEPALRQINTIVENFLDPILYSKKTGMSYQLADHSSFFSQIYEYWEQDPILQQKLEMLTKGIVKNIYILPLMICVLSKVWIDVTEDRLSQMNYPSFSEMHYRRTKAHYRYYLHAKKKEKQDFHIQKALENIEIALESHPSHGKYHYAKAILLGHLNIYSSDPSLKEELIFHLTLALQLGWNTKEYIEKEIAFEKDKDKILQEINRKEILPLEQEQFSNIKEKASLLQKKGKGKQAIQLLECYERKIQQEKESRQSILWEEIERKALQEAKENSQNREEILKKISFLPPQKYKKILNKMIRLYLQEAQNFEKNNQIQEAQSIYQRAINLNPESWIAYLERALFYERQGKQDEFHHDWQKASSLTPYTAKDWEEYCMDN